MRTIRMEHKNDNSNWCEYRNNNGILELRDPLNPKWIKSVFNNIDEVIQKTLSQGFYRLVYDSQTSAILPVGNTQQPSQSQDQLTFNFKQIRRFADKTYTEYYSDLYQDENGLFWAKGQNSEKWITTCHKSWDDVVKFMNASGFFEVSYPNKSLNLTTDTKQLANFCDCSMTQLMREGCVCGSIKRYRV